MENKKFSGGNVIVDKNLELNLKLIELIRSRRPLYDSNLPIAERDDAIQDILWLECSKAINLSVEDCRNRWEYLLGTYILYQQFYPSILYKWPYKIHLTFMADIVASNIHEELNNKKSNIQNYCDTDEIIDVIGAPKTECEGSLDNGNEEQIKTTDDPVSVKEDAAIELPAPALDTFQNWTNIDWQALSESRGPVVNEFTAPSCLLTPSMKRKIYQGKEKQALEPLAVQEYQEQCPLTSVMHLEGNEPAMKLSAYGKKTVYEHDKDGIETGDYLHDGGSNIKYSSEMDSEHQVKGNTIQFNENVEKDEPAKKLIKLTVKDKSAESIEVGNTSIIQLPGYQKAKDEIECFMDFLNQKIRKLPNEDISELQMKFISMIIEKEKHQN